MLGEDICLFRGANGDVVAIQDVCPHRGARLSEGDCHYRGTVACPYHGWVFDESGKNVAVLSEGPDSGVCGKPGTEAKIYPTRTLKGVVFVWIGEGEPGAHRGGRPRGVLRRRGPRPHRPGALAVQLGSGPRELDGLARQLRAPQRAGRGPHGLHRPRRPGRAPHLRGQRLRRRRRREQLHAPQPHPRRVRQRLAVAEDELPPRLDLAAPAVRRAGAATDPAAADGPLVQRSPPARHVPGRVRLRPLHADVRAGRGAPDAGVVLPLPAAEERAPARVAAPAVLRPAPLDHRVQLLAPGRARDAQPALRHAREAVGDRRRGHPVAPAGGDQARGRPQRALRVLATPTAWRRTRCPSSRVSVRYLQEQARAKASAR